MNFKIDYVLVADKVLVEEDTRKLTVVGMFTTINLHGEPSFLTPLTVLAKVSNLIGKINAKISILNPKGEEVAFVNIVGENEEKNPLNLRGVFTAVKITDEGDYNVKITLNGLVTTSFGFTVVKGVKK